MHFKSFSFFFQPTTLAKNVSSLASSAANSNLRISLSVFKSKITKAGGVICSGLPRISASPVSITQRRSHSSTRMRNVDTMVALFWSPASARAAFGAFARPPTVVSVSSTTSGAEFFLD